MDVAILAGGKGTRLGLDNLPKPMVDFDGLPLLHRQLNALDKAKIFNRVFLLTGYMGSIIKEYFVDVEFSNINLFFIQEKSPIGTAGALAQLSDNISDRFLVVYGDTYFDINLERFVSFDKRLSTPLGTLFIHPNDHPYDSDLVVFGENNLIKKIIPKPHDKDLPLRNFANAALYILSNKIFNLPLKFKNKDLGRDIFPEIPQDKLAGYMSSEYIKDVGTKQRLKSAVDTFRLGESRRKNLKHKQKAIFFDRDGVINQEKTPFVNLSNFEIYDDVSKFMKIARKKGYLLFIVTNQPVIAKGFISIDELDHIHQKLEQYLLNEGIFIDEIKYCPHHPEKGFIGELPEFKIVCNCRKPETKMVSDLISHYNIDVNRSFLIGDRYRDIEAGNRSGLKSILIQRGLNGDDKNLFPDTIPNHIFKSLYEINII